MLFNSVEFFIFFAIVYGCYVILTHRWQNFLLLIASYIFYASWDWRFLSLIFISTCVDYFCGLKIDEAKADSRRKLFLAVSVVVNLSILFIFKYFHFFSSNLQLLMQSIGLKASWSTIHIILPMGISFYTFQTMSYTIDIYYKRMKPTRHFWDFALFVAFFPQLVAGPIERAKHLLPQILSARILTGKQLQQGIYLILFGLFQKVFIADNLATIVDPVFSGEVSYDGANLLIAMYAFTFQIYCDFAGYSNIARGLGRMMGFDIMENFQLPFFTTNVQEFWNRWHISLSLWIRDYLYIPLVGCLKKIKGNLRIYTALMISMALIGLWHGANWNFLIFGLYYGVMLCIYVFLRVRFPHGVINPKGSLGKFCWKWLRILGVFHITVFGLMLFRAQSMGQIMEISHSLFNVWGAQSMGIICMGMGELILFLWLFLMIEHYQYLKNDRLVILKLSAVKQSIIFLLFVMWAVILTLWGKDSLSGIANEFIYFQF